MNEYRCLKETDYVTDCYYLVPIRHEHIYDIMQWRNEQMDVLRQTNVLTREDQERYYQTVILAGFRDRHPTQILFSFLCQKELIGYGGLVHLNWNDRRGEVSFLEKTSRALDPDLYEKDFAAFIRLIKMVAFEDLELNRISGETFDLRPRHIHVMEQNGFVLEGRMREQVFREGRFVDSLIHGLLRSQYLTDKKTAEK